jgi:hypothetical protein
VLALLLRHLGSPTSIQTRDRHLLCLFQSRSATILFFRLIANPDASGASQRRPASVNWAFFPVSGPRPSLRRLSVREQILRYRLQRDQPWWFATRPEISGSRAEPTVLLSLGYSEPRGCERSVLGSRLMCHPIGVPTHDWTDRNHEQERHAHYHACHCSEHPTAEYQMTSPCLPECLALSRARLDCSASRYSRDLR